MKQQIFIVVILALALSGCAKHVIPEISPPIAEEQVLDLSTKNLSGTLVDTGSQLVFTALDGELFRWDPELQMVNSLVRLNSPIDPNIFSQGNYLILKQLKDGKFSIFDITQLKEIATLEHVNIDRVLALDDEIVAYLVNHEVHLFNYRSNRLLKTLKISKRKNFHLYNSIFKGNRLYFLSSRFLYIYDKSRDAVQQVTLTHPASSGFLLDGGVIYYGSARRELVKCSLKSGHISWAFKIAEVLTEKPCKIGPYIVIIPQDNNIYFFKKSGTLYWWEKLNSSRLRSPVPLEDNVAVFLWDKKIKFFNYKKKQIVTYLLNRTVTSNPVRSGDYIYVVSRDSGSEEEEGEGFFPSHLSKIGNHYGIEINTEPKYVKAMGKSVRFDLKYFNLIKPKYAIKILKDQPGDQTPVYDKIITPEDKPSFVWIPKEAIQYRLVVEIDAENKKGLTVEESINAIDVQAILRNYYYQLQNRCEFDRFD
jgi:hypothetical protein